MQEDLGSLDAVDPVVGLTYIIKNKSFLLSEINKPVMRAVQMTAGYAAFFRYVKEQFPDEWALFIKSLEAESNIVAIKTPTEVPKVRH
jgi:hypothetical protein